MYIHYLFLCCNFNLKRPRGHPVTAQQGASLTPAMLCCYICGSVECSHQLHRHEDPRTILVHGFACTGPISGSHCAEVHGAVKEPLPSSELSSTAAGGGTVEQLPCSCASQELGTSLASHSHTLHACMAHMESSGHSGQSQKTFTCESAEASAA